LDERDELGFDFFFAASWLGSALLFLRHADSGAENRGSRQRFNEHDIVGEGHMIVGSSTGQQ
jgi:hypothetical protein